MWKTSINPSAFTRSMAVLRAQNAPVRPIPALQGVLGGGDRVRGCNYKVRLDTHQCKPLHDIMVISTTSSILYSQHIWAIVCRMT